MTPFTLAKKPYKSCGLSPNHACLQVSERIFLIWTNVSNCPTGRTSVLQETFHVHRISYREAVVMARSPHGNSYQGAWRAIKNKKRGATNSRLFPQATAFMIQVVAKTHMGEGTQDMARGDVDGRSDQLDRGARSSLTRHRGKSCSLHNFLIRCPFDPVLFALNPIFHCLSSHGLLHC